MTAPEPTRERILRAAASLFATQGYQGTSTRDIADAVGIKQPSLFHHFATKAEIMAALQALDLQPSVGLLEAFAAHDGSPAASLYAAVRLEVRHLLASSYDFRGTSTPIVLNDPAFATATGWFARIQIARTRLIERGVAAGELTAIDPSFANRAIEWSIDGVVSDAQRVAPGRIDEFAEQVAGFALRALLVEPGRLDDVRREALALSDPTDRELGDR